MSAAFVFVFLLFALAIPLLLWLAIENETSDPAVVDRSEAERIAKERGGRSPSQSGGGPDASATDRTGRDDRGGDRHAESGWGHRTDRDDSDDRP
ncbi:hypothetical protein ACFO5R_12405 [Halosolutus amylolyticus]|uniref:Secreted protein n=1 Tax=Halosolutus amylolyticus TaxID=2932267 RepID=A0ABD5PQK0_9EURY|nr:hypothetical protein [Halosolutus amylolyticus]